MKKEGKTYAIKSYADALENKQREVDAVRREEDARPAGGRKMRAIFRYPGSKWSLADWIISFFPEGYEHMVYLEAFAGSGAVFFNLPSGQLPV